MNREALESLEFGDSTVLRNVVLRCDAAQRAEIERLQVLSETLKLQAQCHAQEAKTANSTIYEIYQCVSGSTGEVGNWHGAQPVRDALERLHAQLATVKGETAKLDQELRHQLWISHGCAISCLYGDDGEMQCSQIMHHPLLDFKRDPLPLLMRRIFEARLSMAAKQKEQG